MHRTSAAKHISTALTAHGPKRGQRREAYLYGFDRAPLSAESAAKHITTALTAHGSKRGQRRERM